MCMTVLLFYNLCNFPRFCGFMLSHCPLCPQVIPHWQHDGCLEVRPSVASSYASKSSFFKIRFFLKAFMSGYGTFYMSIPLVHLNKRFFWFTSHVSNTTVCMVQCLEKAAPWHFSYFLAFHPVNLMDMYLERYIYTFFSFQFQEIKRTEKLSLL